MVKGLKATSSPLMISEKLTSTGGNAFVQETVSLPLNTLDREVFVVTGVDINVSAPDVHAANNSQVGCSVSTTSRTSLGTIGDSQVLADKYRDIKRDAAVAVAFEGFFGETPNAGIEYVGIIATEDFFIQLDGSNNAADKFANVRLYGYRAQASAEIYAALVQAELLS
jgi:hypothetical protein